MKSFINLFIVLLFIFSTGLQAQSNKAQKAKQGAGNGAIIGAVAGALFGDGDVLGDAVGGALIGTGVGAATGAIQGGKIDRREKEENEALIRAYGEDNLRGYIELLHCNHEKAIALFKVEQVSSNRNHQLIGLWLEASAEKDRKNSKKLDTLLDQMVAQDPDIDDKDMAKAAINQQVLELRGYRRSNGGGSCISI